MFWLSEKKNRSKIKCESLGHVRVFKLLLLTPTIVQGWIYWVFPGGSVISEEPSSYQSLNSERSQTRKVPFRLCFVTFIIRINVSLVFKKKSFTFCLVLLKDPRPCDGPQVRWVSWAAADHVLAAAKAADWHKKVFSCLFLEQHPHWSACDHRPRPFVHRLFKQLGNAATFQADLMPDLNSKQAEPILLDQIFAETVSRQKYLYFLLWTKEKWQICFTTWSRSRKKENLSLNVWMQTQLTDQKESKESVACWVPLKGCGSASAQKRNLWMHHTKGNQCWSCEEESSSILQKNCGGGTCGPRPGESLTDWTLNVGAEEAGRCANANA